MSIRDIKPGISIAKTGEWDYSHLLRPEQKQAGYEIRVRSKPDDPNTIQVRLRKGHLPEVARVIGFLIGNNRMEPHASRPVPAAVRGQGLGRAMYEALYSHANQKHGVKVVEGGYHTADARRVHESLARRHGLKYNPEPGFAANRGGPYRYMLKDEDSGEPQDGECPKCGGVHVKMALIGEPVFVCKDCDHKWPVEKSPGLENSDIGTKLPDGTVVTKEMVKSQSFTRSAKMKHPAFRHRQTGRVYPIPGFHDTEMLMEQANPETPIYVPEEWDEGFVDHAGRFYDRKQAARAVGAPPVQSGGPLGLESTDYREGHREGLYKSEPGSPKWVKHPELPSRIQKIFDAVRRNLTPDLLGRDTGGRDWSDPKVRGSSHPYAGHCYVAAEALWHLLDGNRTGWERMHLSTDGEPHWFLQHKKTGVILDPTAEQYDKRPDYERARAKGFSVGPPHYDPSKPSKRAQIVVDRVKSELRKTEDDGFQELAKTVGYITFPKLGVTDVQEPMTYPKGEGFLSRGKKGRKLFGARYQLAEDPREQGTVTGGVQGIERRRRGEDISDTSKQTGAGFWGTGQVESDTSKPVPSPQRVATGFVVEGKKHGLVGTRAHEAQHSVFSQLSHRYGGAVLHDVLKRLISKLPAEGQIVGQKAMSVSGYSMGLDPEEFVTTHQQFLIDPRSRKAIYAALGIQEADQRHFYKVMRQNFERMRHAAAAIKPGPKTGYPRLRSRLKKSDDLQKSIASIPQGRILAHNPMTNESMHDYSHVLPSQLQAQGYKLRLHHVPRVNSLIARVYDPKGQRVGSLTTFQNVEQGEHVLGVDTAHVKKPHRGIGLGVALYEASYAHAARALRARKVVGDAHSLDAHHVHEALARKHGLAYQPEYVDPEDYSPYGVGNATAGPYGYALKSEREPGSYVNLGKVEE